MNRQERISAIRDSAGKVAGRLAKINEKSHKLDLSMLTTDQLLLFRALLYKAHGDSEHLSINVLETPIFKLSGLGSVASMRDKQPLDFDRLSTDEKAALDDLRNFVANSSQENENGALPP